MDHFRLHRISAGHYRNITGNECWRLEPGDPGRVASLPWRLTGPEGWYGDHPTLRAAQASLYEEEETP